MPSSSKVRFSLSRSCAAASARSGGAIRALPGSPSSASTGMFSQSKVTTSQLSESCEVVTFDWENIPVEALEGLPGNARIAPPLRALAAAQDRLSEKRTFELLGIPTTRYAAVDSRAALEAAV